MATLKDISKATGVSVTQVSRALAGYSDVNAETREKVRLAAEALGYRPNAMARGLKTGRTGIVALVLQADIDASAQEILFEMTLGISSALSRQGLKLILHVDTDGGAGVYRSLIDWGAVDGFVVLSPQKADPRIALLLERGVPHVVHGRDPTQDHPFVDVDNAAIGRELARRTLEGGHRRVMFLNGSETGAYAQLRSAAARTEFDAAGAGLVISHGPMTRDRGRAEARAALENPMRPTAFIAGNTMIALGIYDAARELGLTIPADVAVVAHDDLLANYPGAAFEPALAGTVSGLPEAWTAIATLLSDLIGTHNGPARIILDSPFRPAASLR